MDPDNKRRRRELENSEFSSDADSESSGDWWNHQSSSDLPDAESSSDSSDTESESLSYDGIPVEFPSEPRYINYYNVAKDAMTLSRYSRECVNRYYSPCTKATTGKLGKVKNNLQTRGTAKWRCTEMLHMLLVCCLPFAYTACCIKCHFGFYRGFQGVWMIKNGLYLVGFDNKIMCNMAEKGLHGHEVRPLKALSVYRVPFSEESS